MTPLDPYIMGSPDPWAHALHFAEAVLDEGHAQHHWATGQWRGLMALLALRSHHGDGFALTLEDAALDSATPLAATFLAYAPMRGIASAQALWHSPMVVRGSQRGWPPQSVAMVNPLCLVSPARSFDEGWPVPAWMARGLCDPLAADTPPPLTELALLASWLSVVEGALLAVPDPAATAIHARVHAFRGDCVAALGDQNIEVSADAPIGCPLPPPFSALFTDCRIAAVANPAALAKGQLALTLPPLAKAKAGLRGVILADPAMAHHYGQDPRFILIWGSCTLAEVMADAALLDKIRGEAAAQGWLIVTANDLFADDMVRLGKHGVVPSHKGDARQCLLPLRPMTLLLGDALRDLVSVKFLDHGAIVTLQIPLAGGGMVPLTRAFAARPVAGQGGYSDGVDWPMHAVSLWPDFTCPDFDFYTVRLFAHTNKATARGIEPSAVLSKAHLLSMLTPYSNNADALAALLRVNRGEPVPTNREGMARQDLSGRLDSETIWQSDTPFSAIAWHHHRAEAAMAFCGLLLLDLPVLTVRNEPMDVAVDFGTTNTMACFTDGAPIGLSARLVVPIESHVPAVNQAMRHDRRFIFNKFLPLDAHDLPIPSVSIKRGFDIKRTERGVPRNVIFFPHKAAPVTNGEAHEAALLVGDWSQCVFNLKWANKSATNEASFDYLSQLLWMIAAEAVARGISPRGLRWHFSVPDAMAPIRRAQFGRVLDEITARIVGADAARRRAGSIRAPLVSEGLAAARYMLAGDGQATHKLLTAVIDIGGATSDIALWDSDDIRWRGSFFLAGRDFFTSTLNARPEILDSIDLGYWGRLLREADTLPLMRREMTPYVAELLFSGGGLSSALAAHWDGYLSGSGGAVLRMAGLTYLGGIAWYLGLVARRLLDQGALHYGAASSPAFALCGRGAGLFKLIHAGQSPAALSDATAALSLFNVAAGLDNAPRPQLFLKQGAKLEVARGLLTDPSRLRHAADSWYKAAGEVGAIAADLPLGLSLGLEDKGGLEDGGVAAMIDTLSWSVAMRRAMYIDYDDFAAFLAALRGAVGISIDVRPGMQQGAWDRIEHHCLAQWSNARHAEEGEALEPVFIMALRQLLRELIDPSAHAEARISASFNAN